MIDTYLSSDGVRAILVLLLAFMQVFVGARIDKKKSVHKEVVHGNNLDTPLIPWGPFFSIWLVIFASCLAFAIWQVLPQNLSDPYLSQVGWVMAAVLLGTSVWQICAPKYGLGYLSLAIILFAFLHAIMGVQLAVKASSGLAGSGGADGFGDLAFWLGQAPVLFFAGWLSLVVFANISATLVAKNAKFDPRTGFGASSLILAAGFVVACVGFYSGSYLYIGAAIWGLIGIIVGALIKKRPISIAGASGASIALVLAGVFAGS